MDLQTLSIEEHERLVKCESVVIGWRLAVVMTWNRFHDQGDESGEKAGDEQGPDRPNKDLAADNDASEIDVPLLLLLLAGAKQPALLRLVQGTRQRSPVQVLQVPAPVVVGGGIRRVYLQRASPTDLYRTCSS
ncbi:hypothetical protein V6N13_024013 [Hibiscus sabdariffa]|uniref:Uncharacterized protein n=1 Tax=Hibiscus sabdariffa TaxID=183260 RepID=A0ABR2PNG2_9ROSI